MYRQNDKRLCVKDAVRRFHIVTVLLFLPFVSELRAAEVLYEEVSDPAGIIDESRIVESATLVTSSEAPFTSSSYSFTEWRLEGVRQEEELGRAVNFFSFTIYEPTVVTAVYVLTSADTNTNGTPDWFELHFYGDLNQGTNSDTDIDGFLLSEEHKRDYHPNVFDEITRPGLVWRKSATVLVVLNTNMVVYTEKTQPELLVETIKQAVWPGTTNITTRALIGSRGGYRFTHWTVNGVREQDELGRGIDPVTISITKTTVAEAHHTLESADTNSNSIPDWFEIHFYGDLDESATSDTDGDGFTLSEEYKRDYHPNLYEEITRPGLVWERSATILVVNNMVVYTEKTQPELLVETINQAVWPGTNITTRALIGSRGGYRFTHWTVNGVREQDELGRGIDPVTISITKTTVAEAHHTLESADSNSNSIPDWFELHFYGDLDESAASDTDGDGFTLSEEYERDYHPNIYEEVTRPGLVWRRSATTYLNMQFFERVEYVLFKGVIMNFFTVYPTNVTGMDFGANSAPGLGDWDGDGDLDIFVGACGGLMKVYENIGSKYKVDIADRTSHFNDLAANWSDIPNPYPALEDWNNDGTADLAVGGDSGVIRLVSSTMNFVGSHSPDVDYDIDTGSTSAIPAFADLTADANQDLLVLLSDGTVRMYENTGNPTTPFNAESYTNNILGQTVPAATGIDAADINYDSLMDILISDEYGRVWEFHQATNGSFGLMSRVWGWTDAGFCERLTLNVGDLDGDNDIDALCGYAYGGLMYLRDPRVGIPSNLKAFDGADSIRLTWDPNRHYRVRGYYVYRGENIDGPFVKISNDLVPVPEYIDDTVSLDVTYWYYVTAVSGAVYPGNSVPTLVESLPSEKVCAKRGQLVIWMQDYRANTNSIAVLHVNISYATGISGNNLDIRITYDTSILQPLSQVSTNDTVEQTVLTEDLILTDNSDVANGELIITGAGGLMTGNGHIFDINFYVLGSALPGSTQTNTFSYVALENDIGIPLMVDYTDTAIFTVAATFILGDVDGDGDVDQDDFVLAMQIAANPHIEPTEYQLMAGDLNGNGVLDKDDAHLILQMIHGKSRNPKKRVL